MNETELIKLVENIPAFWRGATKSQEASLYKEIKKLSSELIRTDHKVTFYLLEDRRSHTAILSLRPLYKEELGREPRHSHQAFKEYRWTTWNKNGATNRSINALRIKLHGFTYRLGRVYTKGN